jgi:hypothetical protein
METQPKWANYQSVYQYPRETVELIQTQGNTKGLKGTVVYTDTLFIDIDKEDSVEPALEILKGLGFQMDILTTGNRGVHCELPCEPMEGSEVPYSQRQWLKNHGLWEYVDSSFYHPAGQYRVRGAIHEKTGRTKEVLESLDGTRLSIPMLTPPPITIEIMDDADIGSPEAQFQFQMNLMRKRDEGQRHLHIYILVQSGLRAGVEPDELMDCILWWNANQDNPHREDVVVSKVRRMLKCR